MWTWTRTLWDLVDIPRDRQEEWTSPECKSAAVDTGILTALHAVFEHKNACRRVSASPSELEKNNGFPTIPLDTMLKKAQEEK